MSMLLPEEAFPAPPFSDEELDAFLSPPLVDPDYPAAGHVPVEDSRPAKWQVVDTGSAEYAMRRVAHSRATIAARKAEAKVFKRQIDDWLAGQVGPLESRAAFFEQHLTEYARWQRETNGVKTLKLPSGEVPSRVVPARPEINDKVFVAWALQNAWHSALRTTYAPVADEVKRSVSFTQTENGWVAVGPHGEVVEGVELVPEHISFTVKPALP